MKLLIFIITYTASFRVSKVFKNIPFNFLKKFNYQILISDDCSLDDTKKYIYNIYQIKKNINVHININKKNIGYGANIKKCIRFGLKKKFTHAIMLHGDNQYHAKHIVNFVKIFIKNPKIGAVTGSRINKKYSALKGGMPFYKFIGNIFLTKFFNLIYKTNFQDCHTGYWMYNLNKIKNNFNSFDNGYCFDIDTRIHLTKKKFKIIELPIQAKYSSEKSSFHLNYAISFLVRSITYCFKK